MHRDCNDEDTFSRLRCSAYTFFPFYMELEALRSRQENGTWLILIDFEWSRLPMQENKTSRGRDGWVWRKVIEDTLLNIVS